MRNYKYYTRIAVFFVAILLISNIVSTKIVDFGPFSFDGGTLLFPLSYIFWDILTEVYGYKRSRPIIWMGFGAALLMAVTIMVVAWLPSSSGRTGQAAYQQILWLTPRIVAASLIAYSVGEFSNSYLLAKIKIWMQGKKLRVRTIGSTVVGEFFDTTIFVLIAFWGVFDNSLLISILVSNYIFKVGVEVLFTPITYRVVARLKRAEKEDYYDTETNFNPFILGEGE